MIPIPVNALPHKCILRIYGEKNIFGDMKLMSETEIKNVRLVLTKSCDISANGEKISRKGKLYFDMKNSLPHDTDFLIENCHSFILFDGEEYAVYMVQKLFDEKGVHHLEISLG